jgi:hypothetical protein
VTYTESGLFWSQCFLPSLVIRKVQAGAGKSSLGLLWPRCSLDAALPVVENLQKYRYVLENIDGVFIDFS